MNHLAVVNLGRWTGDHMRRKMITDSWYSITEYVDSWYNIWSCVIRGELDRLKCDEWLKKDIKSALKPAFYSK